MQDKAKCLAAKQGDNCKCQYIGKFKDRITFNINYNIKTCPTIKYIIALDTTNIYSYIRNFTISQTRPVHSFLLLEILLYFVND